MFRHPYLLLFVIFSIIGILIATRQVQVPQIFHPKASVVGASMSLLPSTMPMDPGTESSLDIVLNPDGEVVSAIELVLDFDQSIIQVTGIKPTTVLPQALALDLSQPGKASIILLVSPNSTQPPQGPVGRVYFKALKPGSTTLKFDPATKISAVGKTGDVTGAVESAAITVNGGSAPPNINLSEEKPTTNQADDLIQTFLNTKSTTIEASESSTLVDRLKKSTSDYIKSLVESINLRVEKEAGRFLN